MDFKKLDTKSIFIIVLSFILILSFIFNGITRRTINNKDILIEALNQKNEALLKNNESILSLNKALDEQIFLLNKEIILNQESLAQTELQINKLKQRKNETSNYVTNLSANGVASGLSIFINKRSKH
jgi:alpha-N-acetylglucosamine transferase